MPNCHLIIQYQSKSAESSLTISTSKSSPSIIQSTDCEWSESFLICCAFLFPVGTCLNSKNDNIIDIVYIYYISLSLYYYELWKRNNTNPSSFSNASHEILSKNEVFLSYVDSFDSETANSFFGWGNSTTDADPLAFFSMIKNLLNELDKNFWVFHIKWK